MHRGRPDLSISWSTMSAFPGSRQPTQMAGANYAMQPPNEVKKKLSVPLGQWNTTRIVVNGTHVEHWLNRREDPRIRLERWTPDWNALRDSGKWEDVPDYGKRQNGLRHCPAGPRQRLLVPQREDLGRFRRRSRAPRAGCRKRRLRSPTGWDSTSTGSTSSRQASRCSRRSASMAARYSLTEHEGDCQVGGAAYIVVDDVDARTIQAVVMSTLMTLLRTRPGAAAK